MPKKVEIEVYEFDELDGRAKERARDWFRRLVWPDADAMNYVIDDFATIAGFCGWDIRTKRLNNSKADPKPLVYWSGFASQGDGACFEGTFSASEVNAEELKKHAPQDVELTRLADGFAKLAAEHPTLGADVVQSGHYYHEMATRFSVSVSDEEGEEAGVFAENQLKELSRALMRWLYRALEREYAFQNSAKVVDENIRAGEYEFTRHGESFCRP